MPFMNNFAFISCKKLQHFAIITKRFLYMRRNTFRLIKVKSTQIGT